MTAGGVTGWLRRLLGGPAAPDGFDGVLDADERILAGAPVAGGGLLVATTLGLWVPAAGTDEADEADTADEAGQRHRRIGWHLVSKATWDGGALTVVEADELGPLAELEPGNHPADAMLIADRPPHRYRLPEPGELPHVVHQRVTRSVLHSEPAAGGGLAVWRRVPGRDGVHTQVRRPVS